MMANEFHYGIVVGINRYAEFPDLNGARADAEEFAKWLRNPEGGDLPEGNVELVTVPDKKMPENTPRKNFVPKREEVYNKLEKFWSAADTHIEEHPEHWAKTRLYVYISGHGIGPGTNDAALLMANAGPNHYGENISCMELLKYFCKSQSFCEVVIFADCCRERTPGATLGAPLWTKISRDRGEVNTAFGCAAEYGGIAFEMDTPKNPDERRSYYTMALLEGLNGSAPDLDKEAKEINTRSLADYIKMRMPQLLKEKSKFQTCALYANLQKPIVFRKGLNKVLPSHAVILTFDTPYIGEVFLYDGDGCEIKRKQIDEEGTAWVVCLTRGLYRVKPAEGSSIKFINDGYFDVIGGRNVNL